MNMNIIDGLNLINKAFEKREERKNWEIWLAKYQHMDKSNFISFEDFIKNSNKPVNNISKEEVIENSESVRKVHQGIHLGVNPKKLSEEEIQALVKPI